MPEITPEDVAGTALKIFPFIGHLMDATMRVGDYPLSTVHFLVLLTLEEQAHTVGELAQHLSITNASMSNTLTVMEDRGWIVRTRSKKDRRIVTLELTETGREVMNGLQQQTVNFFINTFQKMSQSELEVIMSGLETLFKAFPMVSTRLYETE